MGKPNLGENTGSVLSDNQQGPGPYFENRGIEQTLKAIRSLRLLLANSVIGSFPIAKTAKR